MMKIFIKDLTIDAIIGVLPHERHQKQSLVLNLEIITSQDLAAHTDNLHDTLDYAIIAARLTQFIEESQFQLLEALAYASGEMLFKEFAIQKLKLELLKPNAIPNAKGAGILMELEHENFI